MREATQSGNGELGEKKIQRFFFTSDVEFDKEQLGPRLGLPNSRRSGSAVQGFYLLTRAGKARRNLVRIADNYLDTILKN